MPKEKKTEKKPDSLNAGNMAAIIAKSIAESPGHLFDLLYDISPPNEEHMYTGAEKPANPRLGDRIGKKIDKITGGYTATDTPGKKIVKTVADFGNLGIAGKVKAFHRGSKAVQAFLKPTVSGAVGAGVGQHILNENPEHVGASIAAGLAIPTIGGIAKSAKDAIKNLFQQKKLNPLKKNQNIQNAVEEELAKRQGSEDINKMNEQRTGKTGILSAENASNKIEQDLAKNFAKLKSHRQRVTDNFTNARDQVNVDDAVHYIYDKFKKLKEPREQIEFLNGPLGKYMERIAKVPHSKKAARPFTADMMVKYGSKEGHTLPWNDADNIWRDIMNSTTQKDRGKIAIQELDTLKGKMRKSLGSIYEDDPKMHALWDDTTKRLSTYKDKVEPVLNERLEHAARHDFKGNPTAVFDDLTAGKESVLRSPEALELLQQGLDPAHKNAATQGLLRTIGNQEGKYNPIKAEKGLRSMNDPHREKLLGGLSPETRGRFESIRPLIHEYERELHEPLAKVLPFGKKVKQVIPFNENAFTDDKQIGTIIKQLERNMAKKSAEPESARSLLPLKILSNANAQPATMPKAEALDFSHLSDEDIDNELMQLESESFDPSKLSDEEIDEQLAQLS